MAVYDGDAFTHPPTRRNIDVTIRHVVFPAWLIRSESSRRAVERQSIDDRPHRTHEAVAMEECMDGWMEAWMDGRIMDEWMDGWMEG